MLRFIKVPAGALSLLVLSSCGGGGATGTPDQQSIVLVNSDVSASGPATPAAASAWVVDVDGPQFRLDRPATVEICSRVTWQQSLLRSSALRLTQTPAAPVQSGTGYYVELPAGTSTLVTLTNERCNTHTLAPSTTGYALRTGLQLDTGCPTCTNILANYSAIVRWRVTASY
jgi:hypothetical protein